MLLKKIYILSSLMLITSSCTHFEDIFNGDKEEEQESFDFSTTKSVNVILDYNVEDKTVFHIYDVYPFISDEHTTALTSVPSIATGFTDNNGKYNGTFTIPATASKLFVYAENIMMKQIICGEITDGKLILTSENVPTESDISSRNVSNIYSRSLSRGISSLPNGFLSLTEDNKITWNKNNGEPTGSRYTNNILNNNDLKCANNIISTALSEGRTPTSFIMGKDFNTDLLRDNSQAEVTISYLYGNSSSKGMLAYYTYTDNNITAEKISKLKKCILFANTCDENYNGNWGYNVLKRNIGIKNIKYINEDGTFSNVWPENAKIGFVLYNQGFSSNGNSFNLSYPYYSTPLANNSLTEVNGYGHFNCCSTLSYSNTNNSKQILLGFEDWTPGDKDFNDVVIQVTGVFPTVNIDDIKNEENIELSNKGVLAFEDSWPAQGDYDMNDVVVNYDLSTIVKKTTIASNTTYSKEALIHKFTLKWSGAIYGNGFGYEIELDADALTNEITIQKNNEQAQPAKVINEGNGKYVIYVFDNAKSLLGVSGSDLRPTKDSPVFTVYIPYKYNAISSGNMNYASIESFNPFITINGDNAKEIHLINMKPTTTGKDFYEENKNTSNDISNGESTFYLSKDNFPYSINLNADGSNSDVLDIDLSSESQRIDINYPKFTDWAKSLGNKNKNWWKK